MRETLFKIIEYKDYDPPVPKPDLAELEVSKETGKREENKRGKKRPAKKERREKKEEEKKEEEEVKLSFEEKFVVELT